MRARGAAMTCPPVGFESDWTSRLMPPPETRALFSVIVLPSITMPESAIAERHEVSVARIPPPPPWLPEARLPRIRLFSTTIRADSSCFRLRAKAYRSRPPPFPDEALSRTMLFSIMISCRVWLSGSRDLRRSGCRRS